VNINRNAAIQHARKQPTVALLADTLQMITTAAYWLDAKSFRIIRLNTSSLAPQPVRYRSEMRMMAKSASDAGLPLLPVKVALV